VRLAQEHGWINQVERLGALRTSLWLWGDLLEVVEVESKVEVEGESCEFVIENVFD
jgi:hypothetical protein